MAYALFDGIPKIFSPSNSNGQLASTEKNGNFPLCYCKNWTYKEPHKNEWTCRVSPLSTSAVAGRTSKSSHNACHLSHTLFPPPCTKILTLSIFYYCQLIFLFHALCLSFSSIYIFILLRCSHLKKEVRKSQHLRPLQLHACII